MPRFYFFGVLLCLLSACSPSKENFEAIGHATQSAGETAKVHLEALGESVESGTEAVKSGLESVGQTMMDARDAVVSAADGPASAPQAHTGDSRVFEAPPKK